MNITNSTVRSGCNFSAAKVLAISKTAKEPIPLSIAPVAKSQLSKCPPTTTFSFGKLFPLIVATTFLDLINPEKLFILICVYSLAFFKSSLNFIPSSKLIQTAGIGINLPVTDAVPVNKMPPFAVLITMIPLAPHFVAIAVFSERCNPFVPAFEPGKTPK